MRFARVAALAALPSLALLTTTAFAAPSCWYPNEVKAAQLRDFHAMLMVGTLQCRTSNKFAIERYNDFVSTQRGLLDANSNVLKAHFLREHGIQDGQGAYDRYATSLANNQSARASDAGFCSTIDTFIRMATAASQPDLLILAQSISTAPESGACPPANYAATEPAAPKDDSTAAVATEPATAAVAVAAPSDAKAAVAAAPAAETALATAPAKAEPAPSPVPDAPKVAQTAAEAKPAAPPVSREDALQAAVVALQSAAAALQAANTSAAPTEAAPAQEAKAQTVAIVKVEDAPVVAPKEETTP